LNKSQTSLFLRARPMLFFSGRPMRACASLSSLPLLLPTVSHTSVIRHRPLLLEIERVAHARHGGTAVGRDTVGAPPASRGQALCRMASSPWTPLSPLPHARAWSKAVGRRPAPLFTPLLRTCAQARRHLPVLPRIGSSTSDARSSLLPPHFPRDAAAVRLH
jgi:hypothetical protein